jgi:hypothetical protein
MIGDAERRHARDTQVLALFRGVCGALIDAPTATRLGEAAESAALDGLGPFFRLVDEGIESYRTTGSLGRLEEYAP